MADGKVAGPASGSRRDRREHETEFGRIGAFSDGVFGRDHAARAEPRRARRAGRRQRRARLALIVLVPFSSDVRHVVSQGLVRPEERAATEPVAAPQALTIPRVFLVSIPLALMSPLVAQLTWIGSLLGIRRQPRAGRRPS